MPLLPFASAPGGGSGTVTSITVNAPLTGGTITTTGTIGATVHGNGANLQLSDNTGTSGNLAKFDANGNVTDGGAAASSVIGTIIGCNYNQASYGSGTNNYIPLAGSTAVTAAGFTNRQCLVPMACSAQNFKVVLVNTQPASGSLVLTLTRAAAATPVTNADTAMVLTINANTANGTGIEYTATGGPIALAAGDTIALHIVNNASAASCNINCVAMQLL